VRAVHHQYDDCPLCKHRLIRHGVRLPPLDAEIFDRIERAGQHGVHREVLAGKFFPDRSQGAAAKCLSVHINRINAFLEPTDVCVRMVPRPLGPYRVMRREVARVA
jgi:hypothetical protein